MKGLIFSIKRYSIHDGPGIRLTFFMKGCPLSCLWCHNPEGISPSPEKVVQHNRVGGKEFSVIEEVGKYYSVDDILAIAEKERIFMNQSGGGITFSGGEPMMQSQFLLEALIACKLHGYHTAVDTSGYSTPENFSLVMPFTDLFLFDIKHLEDERHVEYTGVSNRLVLENFRMIAGSGKDLMVRIPVIPGCNDDDAHMEKISHFLSGSGAAIKKVNLLPFHRIGSSKYKKFNIPYRMVGIEKPCHERMQKIKEYLQNTGLKIKIGG